MQGTPENEPELLDHTCIGATIVAAVILMLVILASQSASLASLSSLLKSG
jgi:hypothetical protein